MTDRPDQPDHAVWDKERFAPRTFAWVESAYDPLVLLDLDLRVEYANPAFGRFVGRPVVDCIGLPWVDLCDLAGRDAVDQIRRAGEVRARIDGEHRTRDGSRSIVIGARPDHDDAGRLIGYVVALRDYTEQRRAEANLRRRETDFRTLAESSPDIILRYGLDGLTTYGNRQVERELGVDPAVLIGRRPGAGGALHADQVAEFQALVDAALTDGRAGSIELRVRGASGDWLVHNVLVSPELDDDGTVRGALAIGRDVTEQVRARREVADKERDYRRLAENSLDHIVRWAVDGTILYANPAFAEIHRATVAEIVGTLAPWAGARRRSEFADAVRGVIADGIPTTVELHLNDTITVGGQVHEVRLVPERDDTGAVVSVLGVGRDVTGVVRHREELERLARTDVLTGIHNRQVLYDQVPGLLEAARVTGRYVGLMLLDLDGFKHVNDRLGHRAGDQLLRAVTERLRVCVRDDDLLVRLGGDEFVVVSTVRARADIDALADRVRIALGEVSTVDDRRFSRIDASVGVVLFPDDGATVDDLLAHADMAMYQAKRNGRGRVEHFRSELSAALDRRRSIERALVEGDIERSFDLYLQPVYTLGGTPRIVAAEALARWMHPELGAVSPNEFIPIAEECGRIVQLGRWALRRAAELAVVCERAAGRPILIGVNVSTLQFALDDVAAVALDAAETAGCPPTSLGIEITESLLLDDSAAVHGTLGRLRTAGIGVAIDDFGMGYSALHYLARFPVDHLKIDRSFVQGIGTSDRRTELVRAFVALARALDLAPIAEGIETREQLDFLRELGCGMGQGFLFSRPLPVHEFTARLAGDALLPASLRAATTR
jgi:diguanylate cyclase (GGDEF)-like protein/PAS domain S-box-containing protein